MKLKDGVKKSSAESYTAGYHNRIVRVRERLEAQLKSKVKPSKDGHGNLPLEDKDIARITKELEIIKNR